jgi:hypothetical protein
MSLYKNYMYYYKMITHTLSPLSDNDMKRKLDVRRYSTYFPRNSFEILLKEKAMKDFLNIDDDVYIVEGMYDTIYSQRLLEVKPKSIYFDDINDKLYDIFTDLEVNPEDSSLFHFKEDMLVVFVFDEITIKIYKLDDFERNKMKELYSILSKNECKHLEEIKRVNIYEELEIVVVVSKTIKTLYSAFDTVKSLERCPEKFKPTDDVFEEIPHALYYLRDNFWSHRDTLLDNIGYDMEKECYVLFDFEKSKYCEAEDKLSDEFERDMHSLYKSFAFYMDNRS